MWGRKKIDIEKGKRLFYQYYGSRFGMWHDLGDEYERCNIPKAFEREWRDVFLNKLETEMQSARGEELFTAVGRYTDLLDVGPAWMILFLQTRETDTFTAVLLCEQLKDMLDEKKNRTTAYVRRFLERFKRRLLALPVVIDESYRTCGYVDEKFLREDAVRERISAL